MTKKYTPAVFQATVRPSWAGILSYISEKERSDILEAIIKYPNETKIESKFWQETIKPDLEEQYDKFIKICDIRGRSAKTYWGEHKLSISNTKDEQKDNLLKGKDKDKGNVKVNMEGGNRGKPTIEEVKAYCQERNSPVNPNQWFDYYQSNGWKVGKNPMKDWKACIRNWEVKERQSEEHPSDELFHQEKPTQEKIKALLEQRKTDDEERRKNIQEAERWTAFINKNGYKNTVSLVSAGKEVFEKLKAEYRQGAVK